MNIDRMRKLLQALREHEGHFGMSSWAHCAFGVYCRREDLQEDFIVRGDTLHHAGGLPLRGGTDPLGTFDAAMAHFGIDVCQAQRLFSGEGCGGAGWDKPQAEKFVARVIEIAEAVEELTAPTYQGDPKHGDTRLYETSASQREPRVRHWAGTTPADEGCLAPVGVHSGAPAAG